MKTWIAVLLVLLAGSSAAVARWNDPTPTPTWLDELQARTCLEFSGGIGWVGDKGRISLPPGVRDIPTYQYDHVDYGYTQAAGELKTDTNGGFSLRCGLNPLPVSWLSGLRVGLEANWWHLGDTYYRQSRYDEGAGSESYVFSQAKVDDSMLPSVFLGWQQPLSRGEEEWVLLEAGVEYLLSDSIGFNIKQGWYRYAHYTEFRRLFGRLRPQSRFAPYIGIRLAGRPSACSLEFLVCRSRDWEGKFDFEGESRKFELSQGSVDYVIRLGCHWKAWYK